MLKLKDIKEDYDWKQAFEAAGKADPVIGSTVLPWVPSFDDVKTILALSEGENDCRSWLIFLKLKDGRYAFLSAWCDYTGWDCQSGGYAKVGSTKKQVIRFGMDEEDRERLNLVIT